MAQTFTFFEKFGNACERLREEDRKAFVYAVTMYGMTGELVGLPYPLDAMFELVREDIDNSKKSRTQGAAGGRKSRKGGREDEATPVADGGEPRSGETGNPSREQEVTPLSSDAEPPSRKADNPPCDGSVTPLTQGSEPPLPENGKPNQTNTDQANTDMKRRRSGRPDRRAEVAEVIGYLNERTGRKFSAASEANARHVRARLDEGYTVADCRRVVDLMADRWLGTTASDGRDMSQYLRPETLFGSKFDGYLNSEPAERPPDGPRISAVTGEPVGDYHPHVPIGGDWR